MHTVSRLLLDSRLPGSSRPSKGRAGRLAHASEPTMRCPEPARDAMPVASHDGTDPL
jgi:hypothetical protein